jgi:hypothetical protein
LRIGCLGLLGVSIFVVAQFWALRCWMTLQSVCDFDFSGAADGIQAGRSDGESANSDGCNAEWTSGKAGEAGESAALSGLQNAMETANTERERGRRR